MTETITIEKQVWESTLKASMDKTAECDELKQQLAIAVEALDKVAIYMTCDENDMREIYPDFCADQAALDTVNEAMDKIKELEK